MGYVNLQHEKDVRAIAAVLRFWPAERVAFLRSLIAPPASDDLADCETGLPRDLTILHYGPNENGAGSAIPAGPPRGA